MGLGIIIPLVILAVVVPVGFTWAKQLKNPTTNGDAEVAAPALRLTSASLRDLPTPPWRVVYEIAQDKLGGIEHVVIGPAGVFALTTSMDPLPAPATGEPSAHDVAAGAIKRGQLDDALRRCALSSDGLIEVCWGSGGSGVSVEVVPGRTAVDGRSLGSWLDERPATALSESQVDLAWQTVTTAIGRPDPLA